MPQVKTYSQPDDRKFCSSIIHKNYSNQFNSIRIKDTSTPLITRLLHKMNTLSKNKSIIITWIPSHIINKFIHDKSLDDHVHKFYQLQDIIGECPAGCRRKNKEVILSSFRIGHTNITHSYLIKRGDTPICSMCIVPLTDKHILLNYASFKHLVQNFNRQAI